MGAVLGAVFSAGAPVNKVNLSGAKEPQSDSNRADVFSNDSSSAAVLDNQ